MTSGNDSVWDILSNIKALSQLILPSPLFVTGPLKVQNSHILVPLDNAAYKVLPNSSKEAAFMFT